MTNKNIGNGTETKGKNPTPTSARHLGQINHGINKRPITPRPLPPKK